MARRNRRERRQADEYDPDADLREDYEADDEPGDEDLGWGSRGARRFESRSSRPSRFLIPSAIVAIALVVAVSYAYLGRGSLLLLLAIPIVLLVRIVARSPIWQARRTYRDLVRMCGGDIALADRLVRAEIDRDPQLLRREAVERALSRLAYQRGR